MTLRGRAGGVATIHAVKTPRPTDEGAIFAPAKIVTESLPARQNLLRAVKTPRPTDEGAIFAPAKIVPESLPARQIRSSYRRNRAHCLTTTSPHNKQIDELLTKNL